MSVADEISRLNGAKSDLKNAINAKIEDDANKIANEHIDEYSDFVTNYLGELVDFSTTMLLLDELDQNLGVYKPKTVLGFDNTTSSTLDVTMQILPNSNDEIYVYLNNRLERKITESQGVSYSFTVSLPQGSGTIKFVGGDFVFDTYVFGTQSNNSYITSVSFGSNYGTLIGENAFITSRLTTVTIPDGVTIIGRSAFASCVSLTNLTIPDTVTTISNSAFYRCTGLTSVVIPSSVTSVGIQAFGNQIGEMSLAEITFMHGTNDNLTLAATSDNGVFKCKTARSMTVKYYGNSAVANYNYSADNITATLNLLS